MINLTSIVPSQPTPKPTKPPKPVRVIASIRNWTRMSLRRAPIALRMPISRVRTDILVQFLIEAMTLTGFGGLVGLGVGWLGTLLVKLIMPSYVPLWAPAAGFIASVGIGIIFGLWPAWKAARLDPIESLRYE